MSAAVAVVPPGQRRAPWWLILCFIATGFGTAAGLALEQPLAGAMVPLLAVAGWAMFRVPLKYSASALMLGAFLLEGLQFPLGYGWEAPLYPLAKVLLLNLSAVTGVGALRLPLIDLLTVMLAVAASMRRLDPTYVSRTPSVRPLNVVLMVSALTVVGLDLLGTVQGGNFNESLWQLRHLIMFPVRTVVLLRAFDGSDAELKGLTKALIAVGVVKAAIGIWYLYGFVYPSGRYVEYTTSHTDTLVFVPLLALFFNLMVERTSPKVIRDGLFWVPIVVFGMVCNDRRLAYVCLASAGLATLLLTPMTLFKRTLLRATVIAIPFIPPYLLLGWGSQGGRLFWGARLFRSIVMGDPNQGNQADYRDLENVDVLYTWSTNAIIPQGFGHKFSSLFPLPDISNFMPTWQYHPHNQYLWLLAIGGPVGFTLMMLPQVVTLFLCARTLRVTPREQLWVRVWCLTCIAIVMSFFMQTYGDMGTLSWTPSWMAALAAALASKLAVRTGAWPSSR